MHNSHVRNTVRYYILMVVLLAFLFFTNDFGLIDVQKTALILAAGIDREGEDFIVTSQIAIPQDSKQGKATEAVQIVSRGKTVADAFEEINAKTGWYPKLVFCNLIVLGENATNYDVFDALDYFLRDEYFSDNCYVAACDGYAKDLLNTTALVDPSSSAAIEKILSNHAARVGTVLTSTLRSFAIGYFGDSQSGFLPVVTTQPQQEPTANDPQPKTNNDNSKSQQGSQNQGESQDQSGGQNSSSQQSSGSESDTKSAAPQEKPVFSARETALFVRGRKVATLNAEETFALNAATKSLQLAPYTVSKGESACTLTVKQNDPKISLKVGKDGMANLHIRITLTAGVLDYSNSLSVEDISDAGDVPGGVFAAAEKKLAAELHSVFEKARAVGCDIFGVRDLLIKHKPKKMHRFQETVLQNTIPKIEIRFRNVR